MVCRIGYELNGAIVSRCMESGLWSSGLPICHPISCPPLASIPNGRLIINDTHFKATARYECEPGYTLDGELAILSVTSQLLADPLLTICSFAI